MSEAAQVRRVVKSHRVAILFSRDLLRSCVDAAEQAAELNGVPAWVKPHICGHDRSPSVHYTWEWTTREVAADA